MFKVQKKPDSTGNTITGEFDFPQQHKADIINVGVSATGKFIMSCSNDTTIVIWDLKGIANGVDLFVLRSKTSFRIGLFC